MASVTQGKEQQNGDKKEAGELTNNQAERVRVWQPKLQTAAEAEFEEFVRTALGVQLEDRWPCLAWMTSESPKPLASTKSVT